MSNHSKLKKKCFVILFYLFLSFFFFFLEAEATALLRKWCDIDSTSEKEYEVSLVIASYLRDHGWTVEMQRVGPAEAKRSNV